MRLIVIHVKKLMAAALCALAAAQSAMAVTTIKAPKPEDGNGEYSIAMARLALSKIDTQYNLELVNLVKPTQSRLLTEMQSGNLDIWWTATDLDMEKALLPIRIPLYKGLLGHRIFIIRKGDQARFDTIKTFDDLKRFKLGQGTTWADSKILEANGLNVVKTMKYHGLFYMLDGERFDAFPRGVQEPWAEIESRPELSLAAEKKVMLVYRMPYYLFTSKKNTQLAADLELGFNRAIADGSFDTLFYSSPLVQSVLEKASLETRLVFPLTNPILPKETPLDRPELWLDINDLKHRRNKKEAAPQPVAAPAETPTTSAETPTTSAEAPTTP